MLSGPAEDFFWMVAAVVGIITVFMQLAANSYSFKSLFVNLILSAGYVAGGLYLGLCFGAMAATCCALFGLVAAAVYGIATDPY